MTSNSSAPSRGHRGSPDLGQGRLPLGGEDPHAFAPTGARRPRYVQLLPHALDAFAVEHGLSSRAKALLSWLVLWAKPKEGSVTCTEHGLAEFLGLSPYRLRGLVAELQTAGALSWAPGAGGKSGRLVVEIYGSLAAQGRPELGSYVPVIPDALEAWCSRRRLGFRSRDNLLRVLLATDPRSRIVARTVTELHRVVGVNRRRAALLDQDLVGALRWDPDGLRFVAYDELVSACQGGSRRQEGHEEAARSGRELQDFSPELFSTAARSGREIARSGREIARSGREIARSGRELQDFSPPTLYLRTSLPCAGESASNTSPETSIEEGKEGSISKARELLARVGAALGDRAAELFGPGNAAGLRIVERRVASGLEHGWSEVEIVTLLSENMGGVRRVAGVVFERSQAFEAPPLRFDVEVQTKELELARRRRQLDSTHSHGRTLASVRTTDPEGLADDLAHCYGSDAELLAVARAGADAFLEELSQASGER